MPDEDRQAPMRQVQSNAETEAIHRAGEGLIFNDFPSNKSAAQYKVLHLASCSRVGTMRGTADLADSPRIPKIFFATTDEADSWLSLHRGPAGRGWKYCTT